MCMLHEFKLRLLFVNTCHRLKEVWIYSLAVTFRLLSHSFNYTACFASSGMRRRKLSASKDFVEGGSGSFKFLSVGRQRRTTKKMKLAGTPAEIKPRAWRIVVQNFT